MYTDTVGDQIVPSSNFWVMQVSHTVFFITYYYYDYYYFGFGQ